MDKTSEIAQVWNHKDQLEQIITAGLHGVPEIKRDEKRAYLGVFREQVITYLTQGQVKETAIYPEIKQALGHEKFHKMIINGSIDHHSTSKYQLLAKKLQKSYTIIVDSDPDEAAGLVVASDEAVDIESAAVKNRYTRLQERDVPEKLITAAGKKICSDCLNIILKTDPREEINYSPLSWLDRLTGDRCPAHDD
ncbi:YueI family protein [Sporomusa malonica]|uniref:Uncharacterized protein YueI n=1 Tax=Sporomusa malonica TaxID=112901 RepID=A0A1W2C5G7_9FIRM|nr:YueI family protein [Sporomusa malonica]SMC80264.1 Uncharacterized protein YueI [Sporomusa malonica]